jgi:hypothetical protein
MTIIRFRFVTAARTPTRATERLAAMVPDAVLATSVVASSEVVVVVSSSLVVVDSSVVVEVVVSRKGFVRPHSRAL